MFGLLNTTQIYGLQQAHEEHHLSSQLNSNHNNTTNNTKTTTTETTKKPNRRTRPRSKSSVSDSVKTEKSFFATLASMHGGLKTPTTNFLDKFLNKTELLSGYGYDTIKSYTNLQFFSTQNSVTPAAQSFNSTTTAGSTKQAATAAATADTLLAGFNCIQGSYRTSCDSEFYEAINLNTNCNPTINTTSDNKQNNNKSVQKTKAKLNQLLSQRLNTPSSPTPPPTASSSKPKTTTSVSQNSSSAMTIKCSKNLLAEPPQIQAPATLQNYQKLPDDMDLILTPSSGASSGEFNQDVNASTHNSSSNSILSSSNLYKRLSWGSACNSKNLDVSNSTHQNMANEVPSDNSTSSISTTTTHSSSANTTSTSAKSNDLQRTSSASSSSGDGGIQMRSNKKTATASEANSNTNMPLTPERAQRRKLMQMISNYDQQNKQLQRELAKEKRRRTEELACVVKSLICFESKLKNDMKSVNQRMLQKDAEICRLVQQNRALKKKLALMQKQQREQACDEGVVEDDDVEVVELRNKDANSTSALSGSSDMMASMEEEDCLVLEALQCINCKKQFYDIDVNDATDMQTQQQGGSNKDGNRKHDNHHTNGHGSSSDDTVSSSFYGARRSVRYTSKRTSGTFRDYMRSRSMNIDDPALEQNSEENTSTISRDDSQTSYEKLNVYSRTIERMHGVKSDGVGAAAADSDNTANDAEVVSSNKRPSSRSSNRSKSSTASNKSSAAEQMEEDDGIFSPTQDDDYDEFGEITPIAAENRSIKIVVQRRGGREFSEASPKQVYETSTDDWYASASDPEEIVSSSNATNKSYGQGQSVNPVLECVNQILLQQSMEEPTPASASSTPSIVMRSEPTTPTTPCFMGAGSTSMKPSSLAGSQGNNLPRRSSLSGRRSSRSNSHSSDGAATPRSSTLTRKRVHFSTKNSMVHVPRNDDLDLDDDDDELGDITTPMISDMQAAVSTTAHQLFHYGPESGPSGRHHVATAAGVANTLADTLNYESIYSNEYEPIGSELNSSNLYVDMDASGKLLQSNHHLHSTLDAKSAKMPPALPPKPANLLKFKKSLQQLEELPDEQDDAAMSTAGTSEPDYCSISEVNVAVTSVQIVADVHKPPESVTSLETAASTGNSEMVDLEVSTVASDDDDICAASQKTDEIEEIFADIPKLPNVAAIIAPKQKLNKYESPNGKQHGDYMVMTATNTPTISLKKNNNSKLLSTTTPHQRQPKPTNLRLDLATSSGSPGKGNLHLNGHGHGQYKRKHMPNILAEINKRMSLPNSPTTPTKPTPNKLKPGATPQLLRQTLDEQQSNNNSLPLQAEFDWYNLDAEYGRAHKNTNEDSHNMDSHNNSTSGMLADIKEDHESIVAAADEYNLDEEFSLASSEKADNDDDVIQQNDDENDNVRMQQAVAPIKLSPKPALITCAAKTTTSSSVICEAINFPLIENENSPHLLMPPQQNKATKIKKNLANFEKFIEGSGLSNKPLPSKRKIYFAGPFV